MTIEMVFLTSYLLLNAMLVWHDIRDGLLPDKFTCPLLWFGLAYSCVMHEDLLSQKVWGAIIGYGGFAFVYWGYRWVRGREGLGYGDIKFLAALGAWHGWEALAALVLFAASMAFTVIFILLLTERRKQRLKNPLPFGPFLAGAGLIVGYQTLTPGMVTISFPL